MTTSPTNTTIIENTIIENSENSENELENKTENKTMDKNIERRVKQFQYLKSLKEVGAQQSAEWFEFKKTHVSASEVGNLLAHNDYQAPYEYMANKLFPKPFVQNENVYRGNKYEEICRQIYAEKHNVCVEEFDSIEHPTISFLSASPDGIVMPLRKDGTPTELVGRMIEFKCPSKITKTGNLIGDICKTYYYDQVQLQLACCEYDEVDFCQFTFSEYANAEEFIADYDETTRLSKTTKNKMGLLLQIVPKDKLMKNRETDEYNTMAWNPDNGKWVYPPLGKSLTEMFEWANDLIENPEKIQEYIYIYQFKKVDKLKNHVFDCIKYWRVDDEHQVTFSKDPNWITSNLGGIKDFWNQILWYREPAHMEEKLLLQLYYDTIVECYPPMNVTSNNKTFPNKGNKTKSNQLVLKMAKDIQALPTRDARKNYVLNEVNTLKTTFAYKFNKK